MKQLTSYLISHKIRLIFQSAYRPSKSTETALVKISSDILTNLDNKNGTTLALLDLSSAFDTIDHTILIHRLTSIGITGTAHKWLSSFITNRISSVLVHSTRSFSRLVKYGVPQGSVLGPILFNIYIIPLLHLISNSPISFHTYADDIQLYVKCTENINFSPAIISSTINIKIIQNWLKVNSLVFNQINTEAISFTFHSEVKLYQLPLQLTLMDSSSCTHLYILYSQLYLTILLIFTGNCPT